MQWHAQAKDCSCGHSTGGWNERISASSWSDRIYWNTVIIFNIWHDALTHPTLDFPGGSVVKNLHFHCRGQGFERWAGNSKESACNAGDLGLTPGSERSPGEGNGNPLQHSCLEKPMDRGAWRTAASGATKSWTQLGNWHLPFQGTKISQWCMVVKIKKRYTLNWNSYSLLFIRLLKSSSTL